MIASFSRNIARLQSNSLASSVHGFSVTWAYCDTMPKEQIQKCRCVAMLRNQTELFPYSKDLYDDINTRLNEILSKAIHHIKTDFLYHLIPSFT